MLMRTEELKKLKAYNENLISKLHKENELYSLEFQGLCTHEKTSRGYYEHHSDFLETTSSLKEHVECLECGKVFLREEMTE